MKNVAIIVFFALAGIATGAFAETPILPFEQVESGMIGEGRTVFEGTRVESFQVEILGKLENIGPDQNLILGRCSGAPLEQTGVMSGMSGSPVFVDGKLIGAVAYSWGFSTDAIAGITPIEEMLAIARVDAPRAVRAADAGFDATQLETLASSDAVMAFFRRQAAVLFGAPGTVQPVSVPLSVSGMSVGSLGRLLPAIAGGGFLPLQSGGSGGSATPSPPLEPGSAVGLKLIRGDIEMTATGTVTWIDGDRVLAFGHPLFGLGAVDLPMTGATVQALLPSLQQSAKIATPLEEIGALRQDRAPGVFGRLGLQPRMIPVRMQLTGTDAVEHTYSFDLADDPLLSPLLLYSALNGVLTSKERAVGAATIRVAEGSVIKMLDGEDVALDNLFAGNSAFDYSTGIAAYILHLLMNNAWSVPEVEGVNVMFEYDETPRTARVRRASVDRARVRAGETVMVTVVLDPYRGQDQILTRQVKIPDETPPGLLDVFVGGANSAAEAEGSASRVFPQSLDQLVLLINRLRRNDSVYILATREDQGVLLGGDRLPSLPPSAARVLAQSQNRGNLTLIGRRGVFEESVDTDFAILGATRLAVEVVPQ